MGSDPVSAAMARYPAENPRFAVQSALLDMGINPFRGNPMLGMLMRFAPGLNQAFLLSNLGVSPEALGQAGGQGAMFGNYLRQVLSSPNGVGNALLSAQRSLPGAFAELKRIQDQIAGQGMPLSALSPIAESLLSTWDDPQGALGAYAALTTPFMGPSMAQSFARGLGNITDMAVRRVAADYGEDLGSLDRAFWEYLFPNL
jgi:hypothetical protein